jgi:hypothetical protein
MIGYGMGSSLPGAYNTAKTSQVEDFMHGWMKKMTWLSNMATFFARRGGRFLGQPQPEIGQETWPLENSSLRHLITLLLLRLSYCLPLPTIASNKHVMG